jgi:hypothetical protein
MRFHWKSEDELLFEGVPPNGRYDHGMQRFKNTIVIFGGRKVNRDHAFASSIWVLQLSSLTWIKLQRASSLPSQLSLNFSEFTHILVPHQQRANCQDDPPYDAKILIFGGIDSNFHVSNKILQIELYRSNL